MDAPEDAALRREVPLRAWLPRALACAEAMAWVAVATAMAAIVEAQVPHAQLALVFALPVLVAAARGGLEPSLVAAVLGVAAFDFFFTEPRFSFSVDQTADVVTLALLLLVAAGVSTVAGGARRAALMARRAEVRARAMSDLARGALGGADERALFQLARAALETCFDAPAVVVSAEGRVAAAGSGRPPLSHDDVAAARWAVEHRTPTRAADYPYFGSRFDFWPAPGGQAAFGLEFGLSGRERPAGPDEVIELVSGYLLAGAGGDPLRSHRLPAA